MGSEKFSTWNEERAAVQAVLERGQGAGQVAKRNAAAHVAEGFKGVAASACVQIMSSKLTPENAKALVASAVDLPRDKPLSALGLGRAAAGLEFLSKGVRQDTFTGMKMVAETINEKLAEIEGEVVEQTEEEVEEFFSEAALARHGDPLQFAASGFRDKTEPAVGFSQGDEKEMVAARSEPTLRHAVLEEGQAKRRGHGNQERGGC